MMLIPGSSDVNSVFALIEVLADPELYKTRLKEIQQESKSLSKQTDKLREEFKKRKTLEDFEAETNKIKANYETLLVNLKLDEDKLQLELQKVWADKEKLNSDIKTFSVANTKKMNELDSRENEIFNREVKSIESDKRIQFELSQVTMLKQELNDRLSKLKQAMN